MVSMTEIVGFPKNFVALESVGLVSTIFFVDIIPFYPYICEIYGNRILIFYDLAFTLQNRLGI